MARGMEKKSRSPTQRRNERWGRKEGLERRRRQRERSNFEEGGRHVSDGMSNRVENAEFGAWFQRGGGALRQKCVNEANKRRVDITRALSSEGKEDVTRIDVVLGVVRMFRIAGHLSSLRVTSFVRLSGRGKHKIAEDGPVGGRKERYENIRAFAGGSQSRAKAIRDLPFANHRCSVLERVPMMDVSGRLGHFIRDEKSNMMGREIT
jgi:hypothetical protein